MSLDKGRAEAEKRQTGRSARGARQQDQQQLKVDAALEEDWSVDDYSWHPTALTATRNASRSKTLVARQSVPIRLHPRQEEGTRGRAGAKCQVLGCEADLSTLREYHQRYKICDEHLKLHSLVRNSRRQRFCQQCGRFHDLTEFDGEKRSCRTRLQRHNARRRKRGGGQEQKPGRKKTKARSHRRGEDSDIDEEDQMAEAESDPVASNLAQAALNSMLNAYSRSDSKESAATQLTGPPHATLQDLFEALPFAQPPALTPTLPASNQPLRSYLPHAGFAAADVPLYVGRPVSEAAADYLHELDQPGLQQVNPFSAVMEELVIQHVGKAGDDELPAPIDSVALPSVPPLLYAEPMFAQSSFNPTSRPQRQFPPVDPCALERSAEPGRTSNHPDACQPVHTEDSAVLHSASSVTSSKLEEAQRLAQEALSAFSYPSQDQLFRASVKLPGTPADLWPELGRGLQDLLGSPEGYLRRGCVHVTADAVVSQQRHKQLIALDPAATACSLLGASRAPRAIVQWGKHVVDVQGGECTVQTNGDTISVTPAAVLSFSCATFLVTGTSLAREDASILVRNRGKYICSTTICRGQHSRALVVPEGLSPGLYQIEVLSGDALSQVQVVVAMPDAGATEEVNALLEKSDGANTQGFLIDLGQVLQTIQGGASANHRQLDDSKIAHLSRRLLAFSIRQGLPALTCNLLPFLVAAGATVSQAIAELEAEHFPAGNCSLRAAVESGNFQTLGAMLEWCTAHRIFFLEGPVHGLALSRRLLGSCQHRK